MQEKTVIIGGGFAGLQAAKILAAQSRDVLLFDPSPVSTLLPALPDLAGGWVPERLVRRSLRERLPGSVELVPQAVTSIDLGESTLIAGGERVAYSHLLIAAGSVTRSAPPGVAHPGLHTLAGLTDALRIRAEFAAYLQTAAAPHVLVAGTGFTGLELAMSLLLRARADGKSCTATLVDPTPVLLPSLPERQRRRVLDFLQRSGVAVRLGVAVESFDGRTAVIDGEPLPDVFFCWAAGSVSAIPKVQGRAERLPDGRFKVEPDLSLPGHPRVFAAGDSAAVFRNGRPLRKAVNFAYYGGRHAARNIARKLRNKAPRPFRPVDLGWVVPFRTDSIGRLPPGLWIHGTLGVRLHHLMCGLRNYSFANFAGCLRLALNPNPKGIQP